MKITISEYSRKFKVSRPTVYEWIKNNEINYKQVGGVTFIVISTDHKPPRKCQKLK